MALIETRLNPKPAEYIVEQCRNRSVGCIMVSQMYEEQGRFDNYGEIMVYAANYEGDTDLFDIARFTNMRMAQEFAEKVAFALGVEWECE